MENKIFLQEKIAELKKVKRETIISGISTVALGASLLFTGVSLSEDINAQSQIYDKYQGSTEFASYISAKKDALISDLSGDKISYFEFRDNMDLLHSEDYKRVLAEEMISKEQKVEADKYSPGIIAKSTLGAALLTGTALSGATFCCKAEEYSAKKKRLDNCLTCAYLDDDLEK